jgi:hypothetical protein
MADGAARRARFRRDAWLAVGSVVLVALAAALAVSARGGGTARPIRVAAGTTGNLLHPLAGTFKPDRTLVSSCGENPTCLRQAFGNLSYYNGPRYAFKLYDARMKADPTFQVICHPVAHMIGSAALAHFHGNVAEAYAHGSASCASGYYHGILERAFFHVTTTRGLIRIARTICAGSRVRRFGFLDYQCVHGLGHGLMIQTAYDLPLSLSVCAHLQKRWDEISCTGGVFMENGSSVYGWRSRWLKDSDPLYPCDWVKLRNKASCYLRVTTQIYKVNGADWKKTAEACQALAERWQKYCFRSYGRDAVGNSRGEGADVILERCRLTGAGEGNCLYGAARTLADANGNALPAAALCRQAPQAQQAGCFAGMGVVVGLLHPTRRARAAACASLTGAYARQCTDEANGEVAIDGRGAWG